MEKIETLLDRLLREVVTLPERRMQLRLFGARLKGLEPAEIVRLLDLLYRRGRDNPGAVRLKSMLVDTEAFKEMVGAERYRLVRLAAMESGCDKIARLLVDTPPHRSGTRGYDKEEEAKMEFISLGRRRALARTNAKDTIDRLLSDPDPVVISNLLDNPRITETEVVKIASKRPNSPKIIRLVATHRRWSRRYRVMKAIIMNPYTPPGISIGLMEFLLVQDLRLVAADRTLHPRVRMGAGALLKEKGWEQ